MRPAGGSVRKHYDTPHKKADPRYLSKEWRAFRLTILRRDGYRCVKCGANVSGKGQARVDHIERLSDGGAFLAPANVRTLCINCDAQSHREKGSGRLEREERFIIRGADASGRPLDPNHVWNMKR